MRRAPEETPRATQGAAYAAAKRATGAAIGSTIGVTTVARTATTEAPAATTTNAPAATTEAPVTTTEPAATTTTLERQIEPELLARFNVAAAAHWDGDLTFAICAIGVVGQLRAVELSETEPVYEEVQNLLGCLDSYEASLAEAARLRASIPTDTPGTTVGCSETDGYRYCVAAGAPVAPAGIDAWGMLVGYTPEVFCTTDMDDRVCERATKALLVGIEEWGNYGPVAYWVLGADAVS